MPPEFDELEFLSNAALELGEIGPEDDIFHFVADQLAKVAPNTLAVSSSYDPQAGMTVVRAVVGPEEMMRLATKALHDLLGQEALGLTFRMPDETRQVLSDGKLSRLAAGVYQITSHDWSAELARNIEERVGVRSVYVQSFARKSDFLGTVVLGSREPSLERPRLIEAFVRLAAVAMHRRRAEGGLRESERRFRMLAENSQDVIFRLRLKPNLALEYVSPAATRLTTHTTEELYADASLGTPCLYPEEWLSLATLRVIPSEPIVAQCGRNHGPFIWTEQTLTPIHDASGEIIAIEGSARDITARKEAEEALIEADRRKTEFLALLSHELRNPMGSIRNALYLLGRAPSGGEQAKRAHAVIQRQIAHLTRLIDDLLDVTRITRGKIRLQRERVEVNELIRATIEDHRPLFAGAKVDLEVHVAPADVFIYADRTRMAQIFDNLIQNAAKFTPPGGQASVSVDTDAARKQGVVRIHNTGAQISPEVLAHVFEPFVQADRTLDRSKGGLGLGLALVKGLVHLHDGSVDVESDESRGTTFTIRFPLDTTIAEAAPPQRTKETRKPGHHRVLVIEDNADTAETFREVLELHDNTVAVASTGPEGIAAARTFKPDIVFCDIGLPAMNGYEVATKMRADPQLKHLSLVALSGYASAEDVAKARRAGFDRHVAKPLSIEVLERVMVELGG